MSKFQVALCCVLAMCATAGSAVAGTIVPITTPEPATLALLAVGVGGIAVARKLRKRR